MTDIWIALAIVTGAVLVVDLVTTQLRKRAQHIPTSLGQAQEEIEPDVHEE